MQWLHLYKALQNWNLSAAAERIVRIHLIFSVGKATRRLIQPINFREKEKEILDQIIGSDRYDSRIRPAGMINDTSKFLLISN